MNCVFAYKFYARLFPNRIFCFQSVKSKFLSTSQFEKIADETLESLHEYMDDLLDDCNNLTDFDSAFSSGVLTVNFGTKYGTYVINRQTPNQQIWLSSPVSGPKRFDYRENLDAWIYKYNDQSLHELLQMEIPKIVGEEVDFFNCKHSGCKQKN